MLCWNGYHEYDSMTAGGLLPAFERYSENFEQFFHVMGFKMTDILQVSINQYIESTSEAYMRQ